MQILFLLSSALQLLASGALWMVWLRDRRQVFARDIALWYFFASLIILVYPLWLSTNLIWHWVGVAGLALLYGLAQSFLLLGVHRFLGGAAPQTRTSLALVAVLVLIYALLVLQTDAVQYASTLSALLVCSAGVYAAKGLWRRGRLDRMAGVLLILVGLCNLILAYGGEAAIPVALALFSVLRLAVAFTFVFAALNRSTTQAERMLEQYEQLSEQSLNGILVMDADRFFYLSPAVVAIYGYASAQDMVQVGPWMATAPDERAEAREQFCKALEGGRKLTEVDVKRFRADGSLMYLRFAGWPIEWEGRRAMQLLVSDETDRRLAAQALARADEEHRNALTQLNAELERKVIDRTKDLAQSNANLAESNERMERTLDTLRSTQAELVQREKLASLGRMVAGIAHELNTPIGNARTVASTIGAQVRQLKIEIDAGQLKRSALADFLSTSLAGTDLLESALNKAHALITNFRQATKDPSQESSVSFCVSSLLENLQARLTIPYDNGPVALQFDIANDIQMEGFPGHIDWIVEQLVDNANTHAFVDSNGGVIRVVLSDQGGTVVLSVSDNGCGIDSSIRDKVFDPFFSTRLGGSVGLGLNLVHAMVTRKLGGSIQLAALEPHGVKFELTFPKRVPIPALSA